MKLEKLKNLIAGAMRLNKLKRQMFQAMSPGFVQFMLWITTMVFFLLVFEFLVAKVLEETISPRTVRFELSPYFPPPRVYKNEGYLMVSTNGGLNQMRAGICDMVAIARFLNLTLVVPELDNASFWHDSSQFKDIWDVDYFIKSLADEVRIIRQLPPRLRNNRNGLYSKTVVSWSNMSYYYKKVLPRFQQHEVIRFTKTDTRLGNNLPVEVQKLRCRVNYDALRFTRTIQNVGKKIINILREKGSFLALHLRYEMDMISFSGCTEGCNQKEVDEVMRMRYAIPWWKEKEIDPKRKREAGLCPLTPEETALTLRALGINPEIQIYVAAGDIYGGERRLSGLRLFYPNLVKKETLLSASEMEPFQNHTNMKAALDYFVSLDSDIFIPTYEGNMAKVIEGHRRFLGYKMTISLDKLVLISLIDQYKNGKLSWDEFSQTVKATHASRTGRSPSQRQQFTGKPKQEDYFYANPQECLPPLVTTEQRKAMPVKDEG